MTLRSYNKKVVWYSIVLEKTLLSVQSIKTIFSNFDEKDIRESARYLIAKIKQQFT